MNKILDMIERELKRAFTVSGYKDSFAKVVLSSRPNLCECQCNDAMTAAKAYKRKPIGIASQVVEQLVSGDSHLVLSEAETVMPGFINLKLSDAFLAEYAGAMASTDKLGLEAPEKPETVIVGYGGANVAKPFRMGHLRVAIIRENIKRTDHFLGHHMIGDVHLGDWGLQMDPVTKGLKDRRPELVYFDESFEGPSPQEASFTISELGEIYPATNARSKVGEAFRERTHQATLKLQRGYAPFRAIWQRIVAVSVSDLKKSYANPNVEFDLWKGESDAEPCIGDMIQMLVDKGLTYESQGALVVDVAQDTDTKEILSCLIRKSDGASLYATSDLVAIMEREQNFKPDYYIHVVDKRQGMHFEQVFRVARRVGVVKGSTPIIFLGFDAMNGKDGKPFKIHGGGVVRLEKLIEEINEAVYKGIMEDRTASEDEARSTAAVVGLAALKYDDLSNQTTKNYVSDIERFASLEGNIGPYILYTIVRIESIIAKYKENGGQINQDAVEKKILAYTGSSGGALMLMLARYNEVLENNFVEIAPYKIYQYIYKLANAFNSFYHDTKILAEENEAGKESYVGLISLTRRVLEAYIGLLGIEAPRHA